MLPRAASWYLTTGVLLLVTYTPIISGKPTPDPSNIVINQPQTTLIMGYNLTKSVLSYLLSGSGGNIDEEFNVVINQVAETGNPSKEDKEKNEAATTEAKSSSEAEKRTQDLEPMAASEHNSETKNSSEEEKETEDTDLKPEEAKPSEEMCLPITDESASEYLTVSRSESAYFSVDLGSTICDAFGFSDDYYDYFW